MAGHQHDDFRRVQPPLEGSLVRLRPVEETDLPSLHDLFNDPDVLAYLASVTFPQPLADTRRWWEANRMDPANATFAIETLAGELAGALDLSDIQPRLRSATLGIWIARSLWGRGLGTDAVRTVCRFAFREMGLQRVHLHVHDDNLRGRRAYEKVGFKEEGRLRRAHFVGGRYIDVLVMGLLAEELIEP